jgi:ABC-type nitrate/sulfonate/bicarbonate transport system substrate-binding protein
MKAGAVDFAHSGEAPPIFAQAAGAPLLYIGHEPAAPKAEAILVPKDSPIKTVADLKARTIALHPRRWHRPRLQPRVLLHNQVVCEGASTGDRCGAGRGARRLC